MAVFKDTTITDNGRALIANALGNNKQITFTRMVTSSKVYSDTTDISKLINIDEIKQTVNLSRVSQEGTKVRLNAIFTNASVSTSYKIETIGMYAKIDSGNEILYSVTRAAEADTMPATNGINLATVEIDLITEINNSNGATMQINPSTLVTLSTLQDYVKHEEKPHWLGTDGYGGLLQDAGTKKVGIAYYDKANKQMVVPTIENTLTYFEGSKFIPISDYQTAKKLENLFKVEVLSMTNLLGYIAGTDTTEWYVNLPSHIKKDKVISVTNINQASWFEYCNLDIDSNCIRVGSKGNASNVPVKNIKVLVAYFT
nr:MAG TPA: tail collar fiber protein [Caudoviricetes sp.]